MYPKELSNWPGRVRFRLLYGRKARRAAPSTRAYLQVRDIWATDLGLLQTQQGLRENVEKNMQGFTGTQGVP